MSTRFSAHTSQTAVGTARARLVEIEARHGSVGSMVATMAASPSVVSGYLDLVVEFGRRVHLDPSSVTDQDVDRLRSAGFRDRDILDIVGLVALNVLTGTFNLVAGLEPARAGTA